MKSYTVVAISATINGGVVQITDKQYDRRKHLLKKLDNDYYEVLGPVNFKNGEAFGYDGQVNRSLLELIQPEGAEADLVTEEVIEEVAEASEKPEVDFPFHEGKGWYLLSNGKRVRGEDKAIDAQAELDDAS